MSNGTIALIVLTLVCLGIYGVRKLFSRYIKRAYRNFFRGNLREDYIRNNPSLVRNGKVACHCGNTRILLRNLEQNGSDVVREHVCDQCGARLYYSVSGAYLNGIVSELQNEISFATAVQMPVQSK